MCVYLSNVQTDARAAMKNARAKYHFLGQDMTRVGTYIHMYVHT